MNPMITDREQNMIPMITVRDSEDAELLMFALQAYMEIRISENNAAARTPGSDQYALSLELIEETRHLCTLIEAIGESVSATLEDDDTDDGVPENEV
jgi:hypothetical protein